MDGRGRDQPATQRRAMARTTLLAPRTVNFQELIGNGRAYFVPAYQRDYSWGQEQWEDLWNDITEMQDLQDGRHYMGALVVEAQSDRRFVVIDGQQRFATLSVLTLAVIKSLQGLADAGVDREENMARAGELRKRFIGEKDPASLVESSRLNLNDTDDGFYQDYLVQLRKPRNPRGLVRSNKRLWQCFEYFRKQIQGLESSKRDGTALARLISENVARRLVFILITVDDALNAYTVFETLNARELELTTTDLLKNYLFARASSADRPSLLRRWQRIATTVGQEHVPDLLRYHMLCEEPKVRSRRLFKLVRDRYRSPKEVYDLLEVLESRAEVFAAVKDPSHGYWVETPEARRYITELNVFRVTQMMPLLFVVREEWSESDFVRTLKLVCALAFRYTVVSRLNTNPLEVAYHRASKAVKDGAVRGPRGLFEVLKPIYVPDEQTATDFTFLSIPTRGPRKRLAKYILVRLEEDRSEKPSDPETDPGTIEHILPENAGADWEDTIPAGTQEAVVNRIGNLTLLEANLNRDVGNASYREKLDAYRRSRYALTKAVSEFAPQEWTPAIVDKRQRQLAARVVHLWRSDFA